MQHSAIYPRHAEALLIEALTDSPVTLIQGPRQCGKTTFAREVAMPLGYAYITFDDDNARRTVQGDPVGFVWNLPDRVILDEVQRVPALFTALKVAVDRDRVPGRFILTGSTNVLLLPRLSDSLAGRMQMVRLHPFSQSEVIRGTSPNFIQALFTAGFKTRRTERLAGTLAERIVAGGYPAALKRPAGRRRTTWYNDFTENLIQRDVRDLARVRSLETMPRLVAAVATNTATLFNLASLAAPFQVSKNTIREYFTLLERLFLVEKVSPWHSNRLSRLIKAPKMHMGDTGLACALIGVDTPGLAADRTLLGQLLETFVYQELRRQASCLDGPYSFFHYRDRDGVEVDIVIEQGVRSVAGIEVKAAATVNHADFRGLRKLKAATGDRFACGVVLYDGEICASFDDSMYAVPIRALWEDL